MDDIGGHIISSAHRTGGCGMFQDEKFEKIDTFFFDKRMDENQFPRSFVVLVGGIDSHWKPSSLLLLTVQVRWLSCDFRFI